MFTGKNKEDFEKWFIFGYDREANPLNLRAGQFYSHVLYKLPFSMQQGVYLEYLDSVHYSIDLTPLTYFNSEWKFDIVGNYYGNNNKTYSSRPEALKEAFKKADELINANP